MPEHVLLVTGPRDWAYPDVVASVIRETAEAHPDCDLLLVHGMCDPRERGRLQRRIPWAEALEKTAGVKEKYLGADWQSDYWARQHGGWQIRAMPADWDRLGRRAGMVRNEGMIAVVLARMSSGSTAECVAFTAPCTNPDCQWEQPHNSHGTAHCARRADEEGIPARRVASGE